MQCLFIILCLVFDEVLYNTKNTFYKKYIPNILMQYDENISTKFLQYWTIHASNFDWFQVSLINTFNLAKVVELYSMMNSQIYWNSELNETILYDAINYYFQFSMVQNCDTIGNDVFSAKYDSYLRWWVMSDDWVPNNHHMQLWTWHHHSNEFRYFEKKMNKRFFCLLLQDWQ